MRAGEKCLRSTTMTKLLILVTAFLVLTVSPVIAVPSYIPPTHQSVNAQQPYMDGISPETTGKRNPPDHALPQLPPLSPKASPPIHDTSLSIVDILSASPNHTLLVRSLQRARLIPMLNRLNGSTVFAPTNEAIEAEREKERLAAAQGSGLRSVVKSIWEYALGGLETRDEKVDNIEGKDEEHDNLQLALRETLLYHLLNYTLIPPPPPTNSSPPVPYSTGHNFTFLPLNVVRFQETLLTPSLSPYNKSFPAPPSLPGSPRNDDPDPENPKNPEGLLFFEGQKLRVIRRPKSSQTANGMDGEIWVGVDSKGDGGSRIVPTTITNLTFRGSDAHDRATQQSNLASLQGEESSIIYAKNGAVLSLSGVLRPPLDLRRQILSTPSLSILATLLPKSLADYISTQPHLNLFLPTNDAWNRSLSALEMKYLQSGFAEKDLIKIFGEMSSVNGSVLSSPPYNLDDKAGQAIFGHPAAGLEKVGDGNETERRGKVVYVAEFQGDKNATALEVGTYYGGKLLLTKDGNENKVSVNGTAIEQSDILAKNGVIHTVPSLLLPAGSLSLTAEKYLIALNATKFVSLMRSVNLSDYLQIPCEEPSLKTPSLGAHQKTVESPAYTILAPKDDVLDASWPGLFTPSHAYPSTNDHMDSSLKNNLPSPGSQALKELLQYHILAGKWTVEDLRDGMLVGTELRGDNLKGSRQRLAVSLHEAEGSFFSTSSLKSSTGLWGWGSKGRDGENGPEKRKRPGVVGFGGTSVVADPIEVGDSIIYLISGILDPPSSLVTTAVSDLQLSTYVASVYAASLDKSLSSATAVTFLVPNNQAFASLGLVMSYLLLPLARPELRSVLRYHAIDEIDYLDDFPVGGSSPYPTLDGGTEIYLSKSDNESISVHGPTVGGLPLNGETRPSNIIEGDTLISTGVIHVIDQVELPPNLEIGIGKLLKGAKANTFVDLLRAGNMTWVIDGKRNPSLLANEDLPDEDTYDTMGLGKHGKKKKKHHKKKRSTEGEGDGKQSYTILCPTDRALSRLNLTYYLSRPSALKALLQMHIIPTDAFAPLPKVGGHPLTLSDEISYSTLLDKAKGGPSKYGKVAFRKWGEEGWLVGIKSARGSNGMTDSARIIAYGRASPFLYSKDPSHVTDLSHSVDGDGDTSLVLSHNNNSPLHLIRTQGDLRLGNGGGVLTIDSVLLPYKPGWFLRFGWIIVVVILGVAMLVLVGLLVRKMWKGKQETVYEPLEGEED